MVALDLRGKAKVQLPKDTQSWCRQGDRAWTVARGEDWIDVDRDQGKLAFAEP
jgi:hypothetical protein